MYLSSSIYITGSGLISCAGHSPEELWTNLLENKSGIKNGIGLVENFKSLHSQDRAYDFFIEAANQAMKQAGWTSLNEDDGIIIGTTTGEVLKWDKAFQSLNKKEMDFESFMEKFASQPLASILTRACKKIGFTPHRMLLTSACTASTQALAIASLWLQQKKVKRCLVGGVEVLCDLTTEGFKSLQLLSNEGCSPFDESRKGINLSEGAAFVCLETDKTNALAKISGVGMSTDAYHMTSPHPTGQGSLIAMQKALQSANLKSTDIDWIHAHGTGSTFNDLSEGLAISELFGKTQPHTTSTKNIHGHALAASGLIETVICLKALEKDMILQTAGLRKPDSKIPIRHASKPQSKKLKHILKNTLGFGGANASIILSSMKDREP